MRTLAVFVTLALLYARPAAACSGPCPSPIWYYLAPVTDSPIPRDGALVFDGGAGVESCLDELSPFLAVEVTRAGAPVPGRVELLPGANLLVFRPDAAWEPGDGYHTRVTIDNEGLDAFNVGYCGDAQAIAELDFTVSTEFSPPLPAPPAPTLTVEAAAMDNEIGSIVCCPATAPEHDGSAGCFGGYYWPDPGSCAFLWEYSYQSVKPGAYSLPTLLRDQLLRELVIDGVVVARQHGLEFLDASRGTSGCAVLRVTHLGTGETVSSSETCTTAEDAAALGVHLRDVAAELNCADPQLCAVDDMWDPSACSPYDPASPPPAPDPTYRYPDTIFETRCEDQSSGSATDTGDSHTSDSHTGDSSPGGEAVDRGCACTQSPVPSGAPLSLVLLAAVRRRSRRR